MPPLPPPQRRAAFSAATLFGLLGLLTGVWGAHIPSVQQRHGLDEAGLAGALFALAAGAVASLFVAGRLIGALGVRRAAGLSGVAMAALLATALWWPSLPLLVAALVVMGMALSLHDVAINAEGTALERDSGRALMGQLHGMFSVGAMAGAALVALLLHLGWPAAVQFAVVGGGLGVAVLSAASGLRQAPSTPASPEFGTRFAWPRGRLLWIGLLILAGLLAEGAMYDWSVLYLKQHTGLTQDRAALGYAAFAGAMAVGRFGIDRLRHRFSDPTLLASGALLATAGMAGALLAPHPVGTITGFALTGAGLAPVVPLLYTAASRVPGPTPAAALAAASSIGYAGMLIGPPLIGVAAEFTSLATALWIVVFTLAGLAIGSWRLRGSA